MVKVIVFAAIALAVGVQCQQSEYQQCGGIGWTGGTTCASPYTCQVSNPYYSQCLPGTGGVTTTTTTAQATTTTAHSTTTTVAGHTTTTTTTAAATTTSSSGGSTTGQEIRADQDPVFHLYLQNQAGAAVLGPETGDGYFTISGTILDNTTGLYLNIGTNPGFSYLPITFGSTSTFSGWALEGDTIITAQTSSYGRQLNFVVCETSNSAIWSVYLQTGNDMPAGQTCTNDISLHLPCLC